CTTYYVCDLLLKCLYYAAHVFNVLERVTRTASDVTITVLTTSLLNEEDQSFCEIDMATVADLNTDGGTGVIWYGAATGGVLLDATELLATGLYYAAQVVNGCESVTRTEVAVTITVTPAPILDELEQTFCE